MNLKQNLSILWLSLLSVQCIWSQTTVHTADLSHFYEAFDSVLTTNDSVQQHHFIQKLYTDKASVGLKEFMQSRGGNTVEWLKYIRENKAKLIEIRPWVLGVLSQKKALEKNLKKYRKLYPDFKEGDIYFCIGIGNSGGTIVNNHVLVGAEVIASNQKNWAIPLALHEYTHTQQWVMSNIDKITFTQVLAPCILEGMSDFVSELVYGIPYQKINKEGHTAFGLAHEKEIWALFKQEMFLFNTGSIGWCYGGHKTIAGQKKSDLGYFLGHRICTAYYNRAKDKKKALKEIIELQLTTDEQALQFLLKSGYVPEREEEEVKQLYRAALTNKKQF